MRQIWQRYFFFELIKLFGLCTGCFYFLYVLIDYSAHTKVFQQVTLLQTLAYYGCQFTKRADILVPFALMTATIKVLVTASVRNEIVALATGGISLKRILAPFFCASCLFAWLLYMNFQFLQPVALNYVEGFEQKFFKERSKDKEGREVHSLVLKDQSVLIYQTYDPEKQAFFDAFWLKNADQLYRIHNLFPKNTVPMGKYVDALVRTPSGEMIKMASYEELLFPQMQFDTKELFSALHPPRMQSFSQLARHLSWQQTHFGLGKMNDRQAEAVTFFFYKLLIPLACLLAVIGPAPYCMQFTRNLPTFFIYAFSLFGMMIFFTFVNSSVILGQSQVIPPAAAILIPQAVFFLALGWKYAKL